MTTKVNATVLACVGKVAVRAIVYVPAFAMFVVLQVTVEFVRVIHVVLVTPVGFVITML